jgi:hypothetical protein
MRYEKVHCLFEQSGTFKNEFRKLGINAEDYDIRNDFGQTDHIIDLFAEIRGGYNGEPSIFDTFGKNDLVMAFFPCIRFENQVMLFFRGQAKQMKKWSLERKMENCMTLQNELTDMYELVNKLFIICIRKDLKLIVENPYSEEHYLRRYWCLLPSIIDRDRRQRGDYYKKPTQYWFLNCSPQNNFIFEAQTVNALQVKDANRVISAGTWEKETGIKCSQKVARSMIHPDYANRFIREYILTEKE